MAYGIADSKEVTGYAAATNHIDGARFHFPGFLFTVVFNSFQKEIDMRITQCRSTSTPSISLTSLE